MRLAVVTCAALLPLWAAHLPAQAETPRVSRFVDRTEWVEYFPGSDAAASTLRSLRVYPTVSGRAAAASPGSLAEAETAWHEVVARAPDADTPGMRDQFRCHWRFAELAHPGKLSWNLEPCRPVVDDATMFGTGCNPGGAEERL